MSNATLLSRTKADWINIIYEIIYSENATSGTRTTVDDICNTYNLTKSEYETLLSTPEFVSMLNGARDYIRSIGTNPAQVLSFQALAADLTEQVFSRASRGLLENKELIQVWKLMVQFGHLDPATNGTNKVRDTGGIVGGVTLKLVVPQNIYGLEHVRNTDEVIDGEFITTKGH